jgi:PAT family beta-lactamase induction signal transducer AmpG
MRVLMLGAILSAATNLLFAWLAGRGHDVQALIWVVSADNLSSGIASAAFIAYLSSLTNVQLFGHAVRAVQLHDAAAAQMAGGFSGKLWTCMDTWNFSTPRPCWGCRCWCWCGWRGAPVPGKHPRP